jgi:hypothetical protein
MPSPLRLLADQAFSRAAGAPLVEGNRVELLCDAQQNYPAWLDPIFIVRSLSGRPDSKPKRYSIRGGRHRRARSHRAAKAIRLNSLCLNSSSSGTRSSRYLSKTGENSVLIAS